MEPSVSFDWGKGNPRTVHGGNGKSTKNRARESLIHKFKYYGEVNGYRGKTLSMKTYKKEYQSFRLRASAGAGCNPFHPRE